MQIGLIVIGAVSAASAGGYYLSQRGDACRSDPRRTDCPSGSSTSSGGHGSGGRTLFGDSSSAKTTSSSSQPASAERGGFGTTGRALGLSGS
jgi:hypothetical protein